jgi:altronate hydrolase
MIKVAQFGEGNFLRAFADHYFDILNEKGGDYSVSIIKPGERGNLDKFIKQNNIYHIVFTGVHDGGTIEEARKITVVKEAFPYYDKQSFERLAKDNDLKLVISNTTEAGIYFSEKDREDDLKNSSYPAKLTVFLYNRFLAGKDGVYILPVELIEKNADRLKECVNSYIKLWNLPEDFHIWNEEKNYFCNTLVDRIVSGYPPEDMEEYYQGLLNQEDYDELLTVSEPFGLWVIENKGNISDYIVQGNNGIDVEIVEDIEIYKKRKVRILNGSHTNMVFAALWNELETVSKAMENIDILSFVMDTLKFEILPFVEGDSASNRCYAFNTIIRLQNEFLNHKLISISLNSISKWKARVLPTFIDYYNKFGKIPKNLTLGFSYLIYTYKSLYKNGEGFFFHTCFFYEHELRDDPTYLEFFMNGGTLKEFLSEKIWGIDLNGMDNLYETVEKYISLFEGGGLPLMKNTLINPKDNVLISLEKGLVSTGHKIARCDIKKGDSIIKYGAEIGKATKDIKEEEWIHTHNMVTCLDEIKPIIYEKEENTNLVKENSSFLGYPNANGAGIRKYIYIIPTVGCVNGICKELEKIGNQINEGRADGIFALTHQFGCSQLGEDSTNIRKLLCSLARNPNAAYTLFVGLGCENNTLQGIINELEPYNKGQFAFFNAQDVLDEIDHGTELIKSFLIKLEKMERREFPFSALTVGLKCGGSDGLSGITANPCVGEISDRIIENGGSAILTEIPEMFGAEQRVVNKCISKEVADRLLALIEEYKNNYRACGMPIYENPSPGNKEGGITTLEEKSLGCILKGGSFPIVDVLKYGDIREKQGLSVLSAPGNDLIASTALAAAGCQLILFTTGRGTPFSSCVPTLKISSNWNLTAWKTDWIDHCAYSDSEDGLYELILDTINGKYLCKSEKYAEIAFYKIGVTL